MNPSNESSKLLKITSVLNSITKSISGSDDIAIAVPEILKSVCLEFGWKIGELWTLNDGDESLRLEVYWNHPSFEKYDLFNQTSSIRFPIGIGLPGRALKSKKLAWIECVEFDNNFPRQKIFTRIGIRSGIAIPIEANNNFYGVLDFFSEKLEKYDEELASALFMVGSLIGQLIRRTHVIYQIQNVVSNKDLILETVKETQKQLTISEQKFRTLFELNPLSIQVLDRHGHIVNVNDAWRKLWGVTRQQFQDYVINTKYKVFEDEQLIKRDLIKYFDKVYKGEKVKTPPVYYAPNETGMPGRGRWIEAYLSPVMSDELSIDHVIMVYDDVTDKIEYEHLIKTSEEKFKAVFYQAPLAMSFSNMQGQWQMLNDAYCKLLDFSKEELLQKTFSEFTHPEDKHIDVLALEQLSSGKKNHLEVEKRYIKRNGEIIWAIVSLSVVQSYGENTKYILAAIQDITDLKQAQLSLKRSLTDHTFLANASLILSSSLNIQQNLQQVADLAVSQLCDWCSVDLLLEEGTIQMAAVAHRDHKMRSLAETMRKKYPPQLDEEGIGEVLKIGKSQIYVNISQEVITGQSQEHLEFLLSLGIRSVIIVALKARGRTIGALSLVRSEDRTAFDEVDLKLAEELGVRAALAVDNSMLYDKAQEAIKARDSFLSIASHELRTPLSSILMQLEFAGGLLTGNNKDDTKANQYIEQAVNMSLKQIDRLVELLEDLLDVSRIQAGKLSFRPESFKLREVITEVIKSYSDQINALNCQVHLQIEHEIEVNWDKVRFEQVIINLLTNSLKYAPGSEITILASLAANIVHIELSDNGPGIENNKLDKIFQRFERATYSRSISGLGLGLFIVKSIVEGHNGSIDVKSEQGKGVHFNINIPLNPQV